MAFRRISETEKLNLPGLAFISGIFLSLQEQMVGVKADELPFRP